MSNQAASNRLDWRSEAGPIRALLADTTITEIMVNRYDKIFIERNGIIQEIDVRFENVEALHRLVQAIAVATSREINRRYPYLDARLPDGSRVNIVTPPVSLDGPAVTIRKFGAKSLTYTELLQYHSVDEKILYFLKQAVRARQNIIVSGGTGTGKTTLLGTIASMVSASERIVTIEDTAELKISARNIVRMECRMPLGNEPAIEMQDLVKNALRMRPDRLIIGECRGGEAWDMLQAMNTGHSGGMTTLHANSAIDALRRLESMILRAGLDVPHRVIKEDISQIVNILIQVERSTNGKRRIIEIVELTGLDNTGYILEEIFRYHSGVGFRSKGVVPKFVSENTNPKVKFPESFFDPEVMYKISS
jgi:pilus assembly protein CpaF